MFDYLQTDPKKTELYKNVWLYSEVSTDIKEELRLPSIDHGIDILLQDFDNNFHAVQCKFKNDETKSLSWSGDKIANVFALGTNCHKVIVFTNASDTTSVAKAFEQKFEQVAFDELNSIQSEIFSNILELAKGNQPKELKKHTPKDHQKEAIEKVVKHFENNDRGQLILPCGAGKTVTALWIKESIKSKTTLVLVPSLALLKQLKNDWARHKNSSYSRLCVCSEKDIDKDNNKEDNVILHTYEIGGPVTTDAEHVKTFLLKEGEKVIFSTYQSIEVIVNAVKKLKDFSFDFVICDEAHRTAGSKEKNTFTLVHYDNNLPAKKRLYMTATPKIVSKKLKRKLGEDYELFCDMSNPKIYGEEAYHMTFGDAINKKILVDYKIIGIGVSDLQVKKYIDERKYLGNYNAEELANNYGLDLVMNNYSAFHSISFHWKVKNAQDFALQHKELFSEMYSKSVNGNQTTTLRAKILQEFKESPKGLVSNARCLTEGVDVPSIDLIYFCDPKSSVIDIVQASGRALRLDPIGKKEWGYIVVPIFHHEDQDIEAEIKRKPIFEHLIQVIRSLCDHDERLRAEINEIAFKKGNRRNSRIRIDFPDSKIEKIIKLEGIEEKVRDVLFDEIIEKTFSNWELRFLEIKDYINKNGHSTISKKNIQYSELYYWVGNQRKYYYEGKLENAKIKRLNEIGFDWKGENRREINDPIEIWKINYQKLEDYFNINKHSSVPTRYSKDKSLGTWVVAQRQRRKENELEDWKIELLDKLKFNWKPKNRFDDFVNALKRFISDNGHPNVKITEKRYGKIGKWVNAYRNIYNNGIQEKNGDRRLKLGGKLTREQIEILNGLGFIWSAERPDWDERFKDLRAFYLSNNHSNVTQSDDISLYYWCYKQKRDFKNLDKEQIEKLQTVDFNFEIKRIDIDSLFLDKVIELKEYFDTNGTFKISINDIDNKSLFRWLGKLRTKFNKNELSTEKLELLTGIGFDFKFMAKEIDESEWFEKYNQLKAFCEKNGSFVFPDSQEYKSLRSWLNYQRIQYNNGKLSEEKENFIKELGYSFDKKNIINRQEIYKQYSESVWNDRINQLLDYYQKNHTFNVPISDKSNNGLRLWVQRVRKLYRDNELTQEQLNKLKSINFDYNKISLKRNPESISETWLKHFNEFATYYQKNKTFKIKNDKKLHSWLIVQRVACSKNNLNQKQLKMFEDLGYSFEKVAKSTNELKGKHERDWDNTLSELKKYYDTNKTFFISIHDKKNESLLVWLNVQRNRFKNGKLTALRIEKLKSIGFTFNEKFKGKKNDKDSQKNKSKPSVRKQLWETNYLSLIEYKLKNGNCNVSAHYKENTALASFVSNQRDKYRKGTLTTQEIQKLELIGFQWSPSRSDLYAEIWLKNFDELKEYFKREGNLLITKSKVSQKLYSFILETRVKFRKGELSKDRIDLLNSIQFDWEPKAWRQGSNPKDELWLNQLQKLEEFKKINGHTNVSQLDKENKKLGKWLNDQRTLHSRNKLSKERLELLNDLGVIWNLKEYDWDQKLISLKEFFKINGHFNLKQYEDGHSTLYSWLYRIKTKGTTSLKLEQLKKIGLDITDIPVIDE